jgi:tRNA U34 5-carboxymethylaminomethyl modifying GTPase MnmE/TrmE
VAILCCDAAGERLPEAGALLPKQCQRIECLTRADRPRAAAPRPAGAIATSSLHATGIQELHQAVQRALDRLPSCGSPATLRLQVGVAAALEEVEEARQLVAQGACAGAADEVLVASALLRAIESLGEVTGAEIGTDIIDRVFSRHCIGK